MCIISTFPSVHLPSFMSKDQTVFNLSQHPDFADVWMDNRTDGWRVNLKSHTCDSTAGSRKIPFIKPVCRATVPVDQTTVLENIRK